MVEDSMLAEKIREKFARLLGEWRIEAFEFPRPSIAYSMPLKLRVECGNTANKWDTTIVRTQLPTSPFFVLESKLL